MWHMSHKITRQDHSSPIFTRHIIIVAKETKVAATNQWLITNSQRITHHLDLSNVFIN